MSQASRPTQHLEFTEEQNRTIGQLAASMQWVAFPMLFLGILYLLFSIGLLLATFQDWRHLPTLLVVLSAGLIWLFLGRWLTRSATAFAQVVGTQGSDLPHLMTALENLRNLFSVLSLFVKLYVALILVALVLMVVGLLMGKPLNFTVTGAENVKTSAPSSAPR